MPLEQGNYFSDLDPANPTGADPKSQGDDHIRLIKGAIVHSFPGYTGTVSVCGDATGAANVYALAPPDPLLAYTANTMIVWRPNVTNTSANPTLNVSGLGPRAIKAVNGAPLLAGDLPAGQYVVMLDTGTEYRLIGVTKNYVDNLAFDSMFPAPPPTGGPYILAYVDGSFQYITSTIPDFLLQAQGII